MEIPKRRLGAAKLRSSDPVTLQVLTQELVRRPLGQVEPSTVLDLLALSELEAELPAQLARDLLTFRDQVLREINDLPDGPPLADLIRELRPLNPSHAPACLRAHLSALQGKRTHDDVVPALAELLGRWSEEPPEEIHLPAPRVVTKVVAEPAAPRGAKPAVAKAERSATARHEVVKAGPRPTKKEKSPATPAAQVDTRRAEWIEEDTLSRLANYSSGGIKESVLVGGAVHRSPFSDMTEAEVLTTLRRMKREGKVNNSAGRWSKR